jgi:NADPH:quinone reductase-like Zn-dependent oxidoreductase
MRGTVLYGPHDIRFEDRPKPKIIEPTDAIIRIAATCVCGSDLWPYRGSDVPGQPTPMGPSEGVCKKAEKIDTKMYIPVVDSGGKLKDFMRMDEAWIGSIDVAIRKAKTPHLC